MKKEKKFFPSRKIFLEKEKIAFSKESPQVADEQRRKSFAPRTIFSADFSENS
ncbi:MAG: hypothetical protein J6T94_10405 [Bacteroidaceae bacterium]|nr:hypothetical protein [Bacteroidaceae bacterium]MBP5323325.1 hypothetical protein [Bacteroidaceae bacterium]